MEKLKQLFTKRNLLFVAIFAVLGFLALQVPVAELAGSKAKFTLFDAFAPIATGFIGLIPGLVAVFLMQLGNFLVHGADILDAGTIIRFLPMLFAAAYFARGGKWNIVVPVLAIAAFNIHPIGRSAWVYSLFWLIPIATYFAREKSLIARALGATFTAHAVGGALWVWTFGLSKAIWLSLIPVVAIERSLFAVGIAVTYLAVNNVLNILAESKLPQLKRMVNRRYVFGAK